MDPFIIVVGCLAAIAAVGFFIAAFGDENIIWLGVAAVCIVGAYFGIYNGVHHEHQKFHAKHEAILTDLRSQGFKVGYDDVFAVGGNYTNGTEVDLPVGRCSIPFIVTHLGDTWHVTVPTLNQNSTVSLTPADIARFGTVCK